MKLLSSFRAKIVGLIVLAIGGMSLLAALSFWQLRAELVDGRRQELAAAVQSAH